MSDLLQRKGIIKISDDLIRKSPENVMEILKDALVVRIDNDFMTRSLTYRAYSKHFDLCDEQESIPIYVATITNINSTKNGNIEVKWGREKEYTEKSVMNMLEEIKKEISSKEEPISFSGEDKRLK
ncbi:hypothetical protein [Clostridium estertheticum]|uniref:hypothetical protein n=1 Tax=Clostridium estertheticum TaxID=238834 RepID=UPI00124C6551|nr:hypothetical protein [Clostridium estertheticum]MBZ9615305.1 hypothetical protein [Clostridium estertheticum subsp. laramiense]WAG75194.1 hypothetical protein LL032_07015 [Clostridium estertheticum]